MLTWKDITQHNKKHPEDTVPVFAGYLGEVQVCQVQGPIWTRNSKNERRREKAGWRGFTYLQWREAKTKDFILGTDSEEWQNAEKQAAIDWCEEEIEEWIRKLGVIKPRLVPFSDED